MKKHPLINNIDSPHYSPEPTQTKKITAIEDYESRYTIYQLYWWAIISADKYKSRRGRKDIIEKEDRKRKTYIDYSDMLKKLIDDYPTCKNISAKKTYELHNIKWDYS
jgi:hypothetical protein